MNPTTRAQNAETLDPICNGSERSCANSATPAPYSYMADVARKACEHAYAPYSNFRVGCALAAADGTVFRGANIENASYGLTLCAERAALATAVTAGHRQFTFLVLVSSSDEPITPCGACRQVLAEFSPDLEVVSIGRSGRIARWRLDELLPATFHIPSGESSM